MTRLPGRWTPAFTLIELLIVVAIIGVLAAIAVPNFLNAQIRANVARVRADFNAAANALQAYRIDHNRLPLMRDRGGPRHYRIPGVLTTPIAYIGSIPNDPFQSEENDMGIVARDVLFRYRYHNFPMLVCDNDVVDIPATEVDIEVMGTWRFLSIGPDSSYQGYTRYNPTNGIIRRGDIYLTEKGRDLDLTADERIGSGTFR